MTDCLYDVCREWMQQRRIGFIDMVLPFYVASACCHILNLENKKREFYYEHGQPADLRLHVFLAAPPGYMKTFVMKRFLDRRNSIFGQSAIKTAFIGALTEAGYVGTIQNVDGDPIQSPGAAYDFMDHVLGIDEFSCLTNMMQSDHSKNLDNALLTSLDSGYLVKRLAAGEIRYETHLTLHAGSQPARFNLSSGLGRRFIFIFFVPSLQQQKEMKAFRRQGKGAEGSPALSKKVFDNTEKLVEGVSGIREISYHDSIYNGLDEIDIPHYEEPLFEKIALGLNLATRPITKDFVVKCDKNILNIWENEKIWRNKIKSGAQEAQVMQFIIETPGIEESNLKTKLLDFGMSYAETSLSIDMLFRQRRVGVITDNTDKKHRKRFLWPYH